MKPILLGRLFGVDLKANDLKALKLGIENDLGIFFKWYGFEVERSKVKIRVRVHSNTVWV